MRKRFALLLVAFAFLAAQPDARSPEAALRAAYSDYGAGRWAAAAKGLRQVQARFPALADHLGWLLASAEFELRNYPAALRALEAVWNCAPLSPLAGDAALLAARANLALAAPAEAVRILREHQAVLAQPAGDSLLAAAQEAAGDAVSAAHRYQQVYYGYPASPEAAQAAGALDRLRSTLGAAYPPPSAEDLFRRAERWLRAGEPRRARAEYESMAGRLAGQDRELARVRAGAAEYAAGQTPAAYARLKKLEPASAEADAERLYYLAECARRLDRDEEMLGLVERLGALHPRSPWRLRALVAAGNRRLVQNRPDAYEPLYRACYEEFPAEPQAAYCHWKVAWSACLQRRPQAATLLREHLWEYPGSEKADAALYFLGRLAEEVRDFPAAKAYYTEATGGYANHYYAMLAGDRLAQPEFLGVAASREVTQFLRGVVWPVRPAPERFDPLPATRQRLERAGLLYAAGIDELGDRELCFAARNGAQAPVLAMELGRAHARRGNHAQALRFMKSLAPAYLLYPLESAPAAFWRLLFPFPYRSELERYAKWRDVDPFLLAGLVRQESEFDPRAISAARAYGLTQILPSTGRLLARRLKQRFRTSLLFQPDYNLRLGTYHLRTLHEKHGGPWEVTLAAYNAGSTRVENWVTWGPFREPAEFVETIPFTETRNYVLAVLRNARICRQLYGTEKPFASANRRTTP